MLFLKGAEFDKRLPIPTGHQHSGPKAETQWNKSGCDQVRKVLLVIKLTLWYSRECRQRGYSMYLQPETRKPPYTEKQNIGLMTLGDFLETTR